jgi:uncharacterized protein
MPQLLAVLSKHPIKTAYLFGSVLTNRFNKDSDLDLVINFMDGLDPLEAGDHWWGIHDQLRDLLNREIDIVTERSLKNPYFIEELQNSRLKVYGE